MTRTAPRLILLVVTMTASLLAAGAAWAADPVYSDWRGRAIKGYDPVAYFTQGAPVEGRKEFSAEWQGATWQFASAANREAFLSEPERYAPQYGGYCAYAVSQGYTAKIEPEAWKIVDGKLYLNYSLGVQRQWEARQAEYIVAADRNWPGVLE